MYSVTDNWEEKEYIKLSSPELKDTIVEEMNTINDVNLRNHVTIAFVVKKLNVWKKY